MQQKKIQFNLSYFLSKCRQYYGLQPKATFWFGAVLSLIDEHQKRELIDDTTVSDKIDLIKIMSSTIGAVAAFYEQQRPKSVFKLFNFITNIFDMLAQCHQYQYIVAKVTYLNALSIYAIKTHQYSHALDTFGQILQLYNQKIIDNVSECFLVAFSNYLSFLKKSNKKLTSRLLQIETILKQCFLKYFSKLMLNESGISSQVYFNSVILLTGVYRQNTNLLSKLEKDLNSLIGHAYQMQMKLKKKVPQDMIEFVLNERIKKNSTMRISVNEDQLKFYSNNKSKLNQSVVLKRGMDQDLEKTRLNKIQAMLSQSIQMLNQQRFNSVRYATLQRSTQLSKVESTKFQTISPTKPFQYPKATLQPISQKKITKQIQSKSITLQPLPRSFTRRKEIIGKSNSIKNQKATRQTKIKFKIFSTFIQVNEDGILLSDYTNQNKRYIEWNTLSLIIQKIELQFPFQQFLKIPIENYYDFVRIISFYLKKNDNRQICLLSKPLPLLQVNELIKLYKQDGKFLKLALMNQYDTGKFVGILDLYISEYSQFFKTLTENEYLNYLNQRISSKTAENHYNIDTTYHVDYLKRKRETTVTELSNQLHADSLEIAIQDKGCLYKCVFLLKNNLQLIVRLIDNIKPNTNPEDFTLQIKISNLAFYGSSSLFIQSDYQPVKNTEKITKTVEVPIYQLTSLFPIYNTTLKDYFQIYGRMIVDCLNNFQHFSKQKNLGGLTFDIITHVNRSQMIEYGKYFSVVSAELVGSRQRIWALVLRFYDLAYMKDSVTVLMNPYNDFLQQIIKAPRQEQTQILKNLLINQSVRETVNWLKKAGKLQKRLNIFEYLYANKLI